MASRGAIRRARGATVGWAGVAMCAGGEDHLGCDGRADRSLVAARSRAIEDIGSSHDGVELELIKASGEGFRAWNT